MKTYLSISAFFFAALFNANPDEVKNENQCAPCGAYADEIEYVDLPSFDQGDWYSSHDVYYGSHKTCVISFSDGYSGKIFLGGASGKYFIGGTDGGRYYYIDQKKTIRALYIYKKYNCISKRYRN